MERVGFVMHIRENTTDEYRRRHQAVDPELLAAFARYGIHTYSIFMDGLKLFAYMEVDDFDRAMKQLATDPANQRWQAFMSDLLIPDENGETICRIPEVFHFGKDV